MAVLDPRAIRATAEQKLGPLIEGAATWGVLPEGIELETAERVKHRLVRSEPCLYLGPPRRSKLVLAVAILDPSEVAEDPVRLYAMVNVADLAGVWPAGLEDAVSRFPAASVKRERPEFLALPAGALVWRVGDGEATGLSRAMTVIAVGREKQAPARRAVVLVRAVKALDAAYYDDGTASGR